MTLRTPPDRGALRFASWRDAGSVLTATFALARETVRPLLVGYLAIVGPVALAGGLATALFFRSAGSLLTDASAVTTSDDVAALFGPTYFGSLLFSLFTMSTALAFGAALVRLYRAGVAPGDMLVRDLWDETRGLILPVLGMLLVVGSLLVLSLVLNAVPCLGTLAWVGGLVWASPYVHVAFAIRMTEGGTLSEAFQQSQRLVRDRWAFAAGSTLLSWVVVVALTIALSLPFYGIAVAIGLNTAGDPEALLETLGAAAGPLQVLTTVTYLIPVIVAFFVHGSLASAHGGRDLWDGLEQMHERAEGEQAQAGGPPPLPQRSSPRTSGTPPVEGTSAPRPGFRGGGFDETT